MVSVIVDKFLDMVSAVSTWFQKWLEQRYPKLLLFARLILKVILLSRVMSAIASHDYARDIHGYWEERTKTYFGQEKDQLGSQGSIGKRANFIANEIKVLGPKTVLEVGCGYGATLKPLTKALQVDLLIGRDFSNTQLRKAREYLSDETVRLVQADATKGLPFPDNSFDFVFTSEVIMHLPSPQAIKALEEIIRVSGKYTMHNEALTLAVHMFGHDNEKFYREKGYMVLKSQMNPYEADTNMQFIIVGLNK